MADQEEEKSQGLCWGEMMEVQTLLMSLKDKIRDRNSFILRMMEILSDKKISDLASWNHTWNDIMAIMKFVGFSQTEVKDLVSAIREKYSNNNN